MESERTIEKRLRGYATKLGQQPGARVPLHPGTRKMLVQEAVRHFRLPSSTREESPPWPFLSWGLATALGLVMAGFFMVPRQERPQQFAARTSTGKTRSLSENRPTEQPSGGLSPGTADKSLSSTIQNRRKGALADLALAEDAQNVPAPATSASAASSLAVTRTLTYFDAQTNLRAGETSTWRFVAKDGNKTDFRLSPSGTIANNPLEKFELKQHGDGLEIVGSDGSVYTGSFENETASEASRKAGAEHDRAADLNKTLSAQLRGQPFRVMGTNRSSGNLMEVRAQLFSAAPAVKRYIGSEANGSIAAARTTPQPASSPTPSPLRRIVGIVITSEGSNTVEAIQVP